MEISYSMSLNISWLSTENFFVHKGSITNDIEEFFDYT